MAFTIASRAVVDSATWSAVAPLVGKVSLIQPLSEAVATADAIMYLSMVFIVV